ncbi:GNAT family N-acetyltransferase [Nocardioides sp.]|uniref:GNAT family N-acetyltransferase n=1 Tax=Nocardioides sp. TaxID=35761 RepID=UPI003784932B
MSTTEITPTTRTAVDVVRAGVDDARTVHTLLTELAEHEDTAYAVGSTVADWRRMLARPDVLVLLARVDGVPVGYLSGVRQLNLWLGTDLFAMDDLYVRDGARDRGVGSHLMAELAAHVDGWGGDLVVTWGARDDNEAGHRFYRRIGATLRTKVVAAWQPAAYREHLRAQRAGRPPRR